MNIILLTNYLKKKRPEKQTTCKRKDLKNKRHGKEETWKRKKYLHLGNLRLHDLI